MSEQQKLMITDYKMISHLNLNNVHLSKQTGTFNLKGHPLDGKRFYEEARVNIKREGKKFGKTTKIFYLEDEELTFKDIKELVSYYENKNGFF